MKPKYIIKRSDHYELHFNNHVEFRGLNGEDYGKTAVHVYEGKPL